MSSPRAVQLRTVRFIWWKTLRPNTTKRPRQPTITTAIPAWRRRHRTRHRPSVSLRAGRTNSGWPWRALARHWPSVQSRPDRLGTRLTSTTSKRRSVNRPARRGRSKRMHTLASSTRLAMLRSPSSFRSKASRIGIRISFTRRFPRTKQTLKRGSRISGMPWTWHSYTAVPVCETEATRFSMRPSKAGSSLSVGT